MYISFHCGTCGVKLEVDSVSSGKSVECPRCNTSLVVPHMDPGPGVTVGGFKILSLLGKGGMGEVFLARQLSMDREVAIKILPKALTSDKEEVTRFLNEVRLGARLEHPNIVTAYEAGEDAGVYFLAMAYVRGETLEARLKRTGVMTEHAALRIVRKVASALAYAWNKHHLIHRDVKPANIILNEDGEPKLMDMGLSMNVHDRTQLMSEGIIMGTPNYMSPEQGDAAETLDYRVDIYSLGATLYHMVTNLAPFAGKTLTQTLRKQAVESLPDPRTVNVRLSESCVRMLARMLARTPEDRYPTWEALLSDMDVVLAGGTLEGAAFPAGKSVLDLSGQGAGGGPPSPVKSRRVGRLAVIGGIVVAMALSGTGLWLVLKRSTPVPPVAPRVLPVPVPAAVVVPVPVQPVPVQSATHEPVRPVVQVEKPVVNPSRRGVTSARPSAPNPGQHPVSLPKSAAEPRKNSVSTVPDPVHVPVPRVHAGEQLALAADGLLQGNHAAANTALDRLNGQACSAEEAEIKDGLRRMARMKEAVLDSLKADVGKDMSLVFKTGVEQVQILEVEGDTVKARRQYAGDSKIAAWVDRHFNYSELAPVERVRRMGAIPDADRNVVRAIFAVEARKPEQVGPFLAQADTPLGRLMAARWTGLEKPAVAEQKPPENHTANEAAAVKAFTCLLETANLPVDEADENKQVIQVRKQKFGEIQAGRIKSALQQFLFRFGNTDCAARNRRLLESLGLIRVNAPMHVDEAVLAEAWVKLQRANPVGNVKPAVSWHEDGLSLDFSGQRNLMVISALAGLPVVRLDITGTQVRDLSPLRGMPLRVFHGGQEEGAADLDLNKLASFQLVEFTYVGTEIKSLKWMFGMPLTNLVIRCSRFNHVDLRHLKAMRLGRLRISAYENSLTDISALKGMPITELDVSSDVRFSLADLDPLAGMKLTSLSIRNSKVSDLSPLRGMPLTHLNLSGTAVRDLRPLKALPLKWLSLARTCVSDLGSLSGVPLEFLDITETRVTNLGVLKDIPTLKNVTR